MYSITPDPRGTRLPHQSGCGTRRQSTARGTRRIRHIYCSCLMRPAANSWPIGVRRQQQQRRQAHPRTRRTKRTRRTRQKFKTGAARSRPCPASPASCLLACKLTERTRRAFFFPRPSSCTPFMMCDRAESRACVHSEFKIQLSWANRRRVAQQRAARLGIKFSLKLAPHDRNARRRWTASWKLEALMTSSSTATNRIADTTNPRFTPVR